MLSTRHHFSRLRDFALAVLSSLAIVACDDAPESAAPVATEFTYENELDAGIAAIEDDVIGWRRQLHQNPELSNREFETAALVATHLQSLGMEVRTGIAHTGVVGILNGSSDGPAIALRADMDALPVKEATGLPFASTKTAMYNGEEVPVMHACGHDAHTAMLMGAASILAGMRDELSGTVMFVFQPAEEGAPAGESGGAQLMIDEGLFDNLRPGAIFGLHVEPGKPGEIQTRPAGFLASATSMRISLSGAQTHAARPWEGTDLINLSADIVKAITTLSARWFDVFDVPNVATVATINAGVRGNILPGTAEMLGTVRTYDEQRSADLQQGITATVEGLAQLYEAEANVAFEEVAAVTWNDPGLLELLLPALGEAAGDAGLDTNASRRAAAEDFSFFVREVPGVYAIIGASPDYQPGIKGPSNHSPEFDIDERVLKTGVKAHVLVALRYLSTASP